MPTLVVMASQTGASASLLLYSGTTLAAIIGMTVLAVCADDPAHSSGPRPVSRAPLEKKSGALNVATSIG